MQVSRWIAKARRLTFLGCDRTLSRVGFKLTRFVAIALLTFIVTTTDVPRVWGQAPVVPSSGAGNIVSAPVTLDGRELFQVSATATSNSDEQPDGVLPLRRRVEIYENNLENIVRRGFDSKTLAVTPGTIDGQTVIFARDRQQLPERKILSVTELDARIHGFPLSDWTAQLTELIRPALIRAQLERQPEYLRRQAALSCGIVLVAIAASLGLALFQKRLKAQCKVLEARQPTEDTTTALVPQEETIEAGEVMGDRAEMMADALEQKRSWEQQKNANNFQRGLLQVAQVIVWLTALTWIFGRFPDTRPLHVWLLTKWKIVGILLGTYLAIRGSVVLIDRLSARWLERQSLQPSPTQRKALRIVTFSHVLRGIVTFTLAAIGIIWVLAQLHIPTAPLLAGAGIFGFAISFGSQSLVRDVINGTLIFLEDQFAIGDIINVGSAAGVVEEMNLRITQLRNVDGRLSTVPNSSITTVHNLTKDWSRINFTIEVAHEADVDRAIELVKQTAEQLQRDAVWGERVLEPADVLGVNNIAHTGIEIVIWIRTQPGQQWAVAREFRRRLKLTFDEEGILIGAPKQLLSFANSLEFKSSRTGQDKRSSTVT